MLWTGQSGIPDNRRAPIVPDNYGRCGRAQNLDSARHVGNDALHGVGIHGMRLVGSAITSNIDRCGREPGCRDRLQLMAPGVPGLRKSVHHEDQGAFALQRDTQAEFADIDHSELGHRCWSAFSVGSVQPAGTIRRVDPGETGPASVSVRK